MDNFVKVQTILPGQYSRLCRVCVIKWRYSNAFRFAFKVQINYRGGGELVQKQSLWDGISL